MWLTKKSKYQTKCHSGLGPESRIVRTPLDRGSKTAMTDGLFGQPQL